jgi:hypothetical protein
MNIGVVDGLADVSYDFGQSTVTKAHVTALESFARYFLKGFPRPPGIESFPDPWENEVVVFKDFFAVGLHIPSHPILLDILRKLLVQLHQLTLNAIVQIVKFVWVVTSCGVILLQMFLLITMSYTIRIRRFI